MSILESVFSWTTAYWLLLTLYVLCCFILIGVVLLQKGKGSGFAGAFGVGGGSDAVFGPRASKSLPARLTTIMASIFLFLAFALSLIEGKENKGVAPEKMTESQATDGLSGLDSQGIGQGDAAATTPVPAEGSGTSAPAPATPATPKPDAAATTTPAPATAPAAPAAPANPTPAPAAPETETPKAN